MRSTLFSLVAVAASLAGVQAQVEDPKNEATFGFAAFFTPNKAAEVTMGKPFHVTWDTTTDNETSVNLVLYGGCSPTTLQRIITGPGGASGKINDAVLKVKDGQYQWTPTGVGKHPTYGLMIIGAEAGAAAPKYQWSEPFAIKGNDVDNEACKPASSTNQLTTDPMTADPKTTAVTSSELPPLTTTTTGTKGPKDTNGPKRPGKGHDASKGPYVPKETHTSQVGPNEHVNGTNKGYGNNNKHESGNGPKKCCKKLEQGSPCPCQMLPQGNGTETTAGPVPTHSPPPYQATAGEPVNDPTNLPAGVPTTTAYTAPVAGVAAPTNGINGVAPSPSSEGLTFNSASSTMVSASLVFLAGLVFFVAI